MDDVTKEVRNTKKVTYTSKEFPRVKAVRYRDTDGNANITLRVYGTDITISNSNKDYGANYEGIGRAIVDVMDSASIDACMVDK